MKRYDVILSRNVIMSVPSETGLYCNANEAVSRIDKLVEENTKLRALVERAGELDRTYVGKEIDDFSKECREALK